MSCSLQNVVVAFWSIFIHCSSCQVTNISIIKSPGMTGGCFVLYSLFWIFLWVGNKKMVDCIVFPDCLRLLQHGWRVKWAMYWNVGARCILRWFLCWFVAHFSVVILTTRCDDELIVSYILLELVIISTRSVLISRAPSCYQKQISTGSVAWWCTATPAPWQNW